MGTGSRWRSSWGRWVIFFAVVVIIALGWWHFTRPAILDSATEWRHPLASVMHVAPLAEQNGLLVTAGNEVLVLDEDGRVSTAITPAGQTFFCADADAEAPVIYTGGKPATVAAWSGKGGLLWTHSLAQAEYAKVGALPGGGAAVAWAFKSAAAWQTRVEWYDSAGNLLASHAVDRRPLGFNPICAGAGSSVLHITIDGSVIVLVDVSREAGILREHRIVLPPKYQRSLKPGIDLQRLDTGGVLAVVQGTGVFAYSADGRLDWEYPGPSVQPTGEEWFGFTADDTGGGYITHDRLVIAVDGAGAERWRRDTGMMLITPVSNADGVFAFGHALASDLMHPRLGWLRPLRIYLNEPDFRSYVVQVSRRGRVECYWQVPEGLILSHVPEEAGSCIGWLMTKSTPTAAEAVRLDLPR